MLSTCASAAASLTPVSVFVHAQASEETILKLLKAKYPVRSVRVLGVLGLAHR